MATPELEALAWEYVQDRCRTFSWCPTYYGLEEYYPRLRWPSKEDLDEYRSRLERTLGRIDSLPPEPDESGAIDREVLRFVVEYEYVRSNLPPYEESNLSPAYVIMDGLHGILELPRLSDGEKLGFVLARLEQGRDLFDTLRETWQVPSTLELDDAIPLAQRAEQVMTTMLTPLMEGFPRERPGLERLIAEIGEMGLDFARWLEAEVKPKTDRTCYVMGKERYEQLLTVRQEGHTWAERLELGELSLCQSRVRMDELASQLVPEAGTMEAALEKVWEDLPQVPILEEARNAYQRVGVFLEEKGLLHVPEARCAIEEPPSWDTFWGEGMVGITLAEILRDDPQFTIIVVPPTTEESRKGLNRSDILLAMAHEGAAGHLGSSVLQKGRESIIRQLVPPGTGVDDRWTFYWEQVLCEEGIEPTLAYQFLQEYRVFWCSLRHICDVKLHCGLMSFEECAEYLAREGKVPPGTAKAYTKSIAWMPGYFSSFVVGKEQLLRLREQVKVQLGRQYSPAMFHQWVGQAGPIPYGLLERDVRAQATAAGR
jgi:hypothetical protein